MKENHAARKNSPSHLKKSKPFLYRACDTRIQAVNNETLCEIILTNEEQEPFGCVEELQPFGTNSQPAV